ncbi:MAG TPA: class I SAM-dependent methyltransferase [Bryobacteraceae bacterium]|nr:class I SAM-dependent methyltransferase [Bryobacteraceae bacterium]
MNPYNAVRYPTLAKEHTHPDRLATIAAVYGMMPAPVECCRVLELGCGTGANLVPMAYTLPGSEFTGIDVAAEPVRTGACRVAELGLRNIRLLTADIMDIGPDLGEFDYIMAHGVYSWVPEPVRDKLMAVCARNLAPNGVAYISYNALPGCHLRRMVRDMMLYHVNGVEDPEQRMQQAFSLASIIGQAQTDAGLRGEFEVVLERSAAVVYHDDLAEVNHPVYFHEFMRHAGAHGLEFLSEASLVSSEGRLPEAARATLQAIETDVIRREQYLDFFKLRRFRQTLLCHAGQPIERPARPDHVRGLWASSKAEPAGPPEGAAGAVEFRGEKGAAAKTVHPLAKAALSTLGGTWPRRMAFSELLDRIRAAAASSATLEQDAAALAEILWYTCRCGLVELHATPGRFVCKAGEHPEASAVARLELRDGSQAPTLTHGVVEMEDEIGRRLVLLLDGTRDRAALAAELGVPVSAVENSLARLARLPLLVA